MIPMTKVTTSSSSGQTHQAVVSAGAAAAAQDMTGLASSKAKATNATPLPLFNLLSFIVPLLSSNMLKK
jgi:hypothetical protein